MKVKTNGCDTDGDNDDIGSTVNIHYKVTVSSVKSTMLKGQRYNVGCQFAMEVKTKSHPYILVLRTRAWSHLIVSSSAFVCNHLSRIVTSNGSADWEAGGSMSVSEDWEAGGSKSVSADWEAGGSMSMSADWEAGGIMSMSADWEAGGSMFMSADWEVGGSVPVVLVWEANWLV